MEIDQAARTAKLSNKETVEFATGLIATGAMVRRLAVDGTELDGIHYLRALANADAIRRDVADADRVVLIGGSYIGCEVAASLTELGKRCTIVMQESLTLERHFGQPPARFFRGCSRSTGSRSSAPTRSSASRATARVQRVVTEAGRTIPADAVVCGVGAIPDVMLARKSGLELGDLGGVRTTPALETSMPGLFAAGDMCEYESTVHGRVMRIEHEDVAAAQGRTAARNMLGPERRRPRGRPVFLLRSRRTGPRSSTSAPPRPGTRRSSAARSTTATSRSSTSTTAASSPRSPSGGRPTSTTPAA